MLGTDVGTQRNEEDGGEDASDIEEVDEVDPYQKWFGRRVVSSSDKNAFNKILYSLVLCVRCRNDFQLRTLELDEKMQTKVSTNGLDDATDYSTSLSLTRLKVVPRFRCSVGTNPSSVRSLDRQAEEGSSTVHHLPARDTLPRCPVHVRRGAGRLLRAQRSAHLGSEHPHAESHHEGVSARSLSP